MNKKLLILVARVSLICFSIGFFSELIVISTVNLVQKQDLVLLEKVQGEFAAELANLRSRVNTLEARAVQQKKNSYQTTKSDTARDVLINDRTVLAPP